MATKRTPADTFEQIKDGAMALLALATQRLHECESALMEGNFETAQERAQELLNKLGPLAHAQSMLGSFSSGRLVRVRDIEEGTLVQDYGRVESKDTFEHEVDAGESHEHVTLTFASGGRAQFHGDQELLIVPEDSANPDRA